MNTIPRHTPIANLELLARQVVEGFIIGLHKSPLHGFSVEFAEHRPYNPGDSLKHVDWKVFGRNDKMFVKKFEEETNLRCCIAIDTSASMFFPETGTSKLQYAAFAAACLYQLLKRQLDAGALALFDEDLYFLSKARSGSRHYLSLTSELERLLQRPNSGKKTHAAEAIHQIAESQHQRSMVVLFSDMPDPSDDGNELLSALQHLRHNKHEVLLFHVIDGEKEQDFDFENRPYEFLDMESGAIVKLNPMDIKEEYLNRRRAYQQRLQAYCLKYRIDLITCDIRQPVEEVLHRYLLKRNKMM